MRVPSAVFFFDSVNVYDGGNVCLLEKLLICPKADGTRES
jgi:hypothetical protein